MGQEGTFIGPCVGLLKSHPSKSICRPGLLIRDMPFLPFFLFYCFTLSSISPKSACICHLCGYLRTRGLLSIYSFLSVTLTTKAAGGRREGASDSSSPVVPGAVRAGGEIDKTKVANPPQGFGRMWPLHLQMSQGDESLSG